MPKIPCFHAYWVLFCIEVGRVLEPACGDGNFLVEILRRKLSAVAARYRRSAADYEKYAVMAVTSIYGVELLRDNVEACRARLYGIWNEAYTAHCGQDCSDACRDAARFILSRNILCGNALTLRQVDAQGRDTDAPIIFSEWVFTGRSSVKRSDYRLDVLMKENRDASHYNTQQSIFDGDADDTCDWMIDPDTGQKTPRPMRTFPPVYYWRVQEQRE